MAREIGATSHRVKQPAKQLTAEPVRAGDMREAQPEFCRVPDLRFLFGLHRSYVYLLIQRGAIQSVNLRQPGAKTGLRLVHVQSVRDFLNAQLGGQS
jgi:hypothetical protein